MSLPPLWGKKKFFIDLDIPIIHYISIIYLSVYLSIYLSIYPSIHPSIHPSIIICLSSLSLFDLFSAKLSSIWWGMPFSRGLACTRRQCWTTAICWLRMCYRRGCEVLLDGKHVYLWRFLTPTKGYLLKVPRCDTQPTRSPGKQRETLFILSMEGVCLY